MYTKSSLDKDPIDYTFNRGLGEGGQPVRCRIGDNTLLYGLELAVLQMRKGTQTTVIISPEYAYGPAGVYPIIPPDETIIYNIKLR